MLEIRQAEYSEIAEIWRLTHDQYVIEGFIDPQPGKLYSHEQHLEWSSATTPLIALLDGDMVGTCTYTLDSPIGLQPESDYPYEVGIIRKVGLPLACSWRIITDLTCRYKTKIVKELIKQTAKELVDHGEPLLLCLFHPKHENFYKKYLGFETIAKRDNTHGLRNAPSVLMIGAKNSYSRIL